MVVGLLGFVLRAPGRATENSRGMALPPADVVTLRLHCADSPALRTADQAKSRPVRVL